MKGLSATFDTFARAMKPGVDFVVPRNQQFLGFIEASDKEQLDPYESPSYGAAYGPAEAVYGKGFAPTEHQATESAWGGVTIAYTSLSSILGGRSTSHQNNRYSQDGRELSTTSYTLQYEPGDSGWEGERL